MQKTWWCTMSLLFSLADAGTGQWPAEFVTIAVLNGGYFDVRSYNSCATIAVLQWRLPILDGVQSGQTGVIWSRGWVQAGT